MWPSTATPAPSRPTRSRELAPDPRVLLVSEPGSRFESSVLTFGPLGRVACTFVLLAVLGWLVLYGGLFGLAGAVIWVGWVMPLALRDIWRRAALPETDLTRLRKQSAVEARERMRTREDHPALDPEAKPPGRW